MLLSVVVLAMIISPVFGEYHISGNRMTVHIQFPEGDEHTIDMTFGELVVMLQDTPFAPELYVANYKIDIWVYAALYQLDLPFDVSTVRHPHEVYESTITKIGEYQNGENGVWVYYVNGIRSPYHISTQLADDVHDIRFVYHAQEDGEGNK